MKPCTPQVIADTCQFVARPEEDVRADPPVNVNTHSGAKLDFKRAVRLPIDIGEGKTILKPLRLPPQLKRMPLQIQPIGSSALPDDDHLHRMIHIRSQPNQALLIGDRLGGQVSDGIEFLIGRLGNVEMN